MNRSIVSHPDGLLNMTHGQVFKLCEGKFKIPEGLTYNEFINKVIDLSKKLNFTPTPEQLYAALNRDVPLAIDATAGSGKTTISEFILYMDTQIFGVNPNRILLTTFSRQGALSMQLKNEYYANLLNCEPIGKVSTMHAWYLSFLKEFRTKVPIGLMGTEPLETMTELQAKRMLRDSMCHILNVNSVLDSAVSDFKALNDYLVNTMLIDDEEKVSRLPQFTRVNLPYNKIVAIMESFKKTKALTGRLEFIDMLYYCYKLLSENPDVQKRISGYFNRHLIDEVQDTGKLQFETYKLMLNEKNRNNILLVGDSDQSIYNWQGTSDNIFEEFATTFSNGRIVTLTNNLRCGNNIVEKANMVIQNNTKRIPKEITTKNTFANEVIPVSCNSRLEAINYIFDDIKTFNKKYGYKELPKLAVIARNHNQLLWLVDKLLDEGIRVNLLTDTFPYNDKIFIDLQKCMELIYSPKDFDLATQVLPKLLKDYTNKNKEAIAVGMMSKNIPFYELQLDGIRSNSTFVEDMNTLRILCENVHNGLTVKQMCEKLIPLYRNGSYDWYAKQNNIDLEQSALIFDYLVCQEVGLTDFRNKLNRIQENLEYSSSMNMGVHVGSIHSVKGLEYHTVYMLDINGSNFPNIRNLENYMYPHDYNFLEEERNLFYVAMTRAKAKLVMTYNATNVSIFMAETGLISKREKEMVVQLPKKFANYKNRKLMTQELSEHKQIEVIPDTKKMINESTTTNPLLASVNGLDQKIANTKLSEENESILRKLFGTK